MTDFFHIKIFKLIKKIFPYNRSLTGNGNRLTLKQIKKILKNLKIIEYRSRKKVFDWNVPDEWNVRNAYVKYEGKKIIDFKNHNLHLLGYSQPINKELNLNVLKKHLYTDKENKTAIPYVTSYYRKNWGFCVSELFKNKLKSKKKYKVFIDTKFNKRGSLTIGELIIKGKSKEEVLLSTNICHPSMANHELSGPSILTYISKYLSQKKRHYSYRVLFLPETVGTISYLFHKHKEIKKNFIAGFHLTCLGSNGKYSMIQTKYKNSYSDLVVKEALSKRKNIKIYPFQKCGSDERQYNYPGINLPVVTVTRSLFGEFKEYHTSLDNIKNLKLSSLKNSFGYIKSIVDILENNFNKKSYSKDKNLKIKKNKKLKCFANTTCEPFLSKRNLYRSISKKYLSKSEKNMFQTLYYSDGLTINEISKHTNIKKKNLMPIIKILKKNNLVRLKI